MGRLMATLEMQAGSIAIRIKDDRAELDKPALKLWKAAALEILEGAFDLMVEPDEPVEEEIEDE